MERTLWMLVAGVCFVVGLRFVVSGRFLLGAPGHHPALNQLIVGQTESRMMTPVLVRLCGLILLVAAAALTWGALWS